MKLQTKQLTRGAMIAALYVVLTYISFLCGLSSSAIQVRISEALCVLPAFFPEAIPALFIGCALANLLTGSILWDIIFGSLATLIGAFGAYLLRNCRFKWLLPLPTILANMVIVPAVIILTMGAEGSFASYPYFALTVGLGEFIAAGVLGTLLYYTADRMFKEKKH